MKKWFLIITGIILLSGIFDGCGKKPEEILLAEEISVTKENTETEDDDMVSALPEPDQMELVSETQSIFVYVCGAVCNPGVYELPEYSRAYEAVDAAGGLQDEADRSAVNLAETLADGEKLQIPFQGETVNITDTKSESVSADGKININTASMEELMTLKGIGQTRAEQIMEYREKHGSFANAEAIMNVDGIKQGTFDKIKDKITVQ